MKDTTLDPKRQLLIAALYGELDADGEARFQAAIEADPVLRAEWDELRETRALLETASATEPAITREFVFVRPPETKPTWRQRIFAFSPALGFASVACGLVILLGAGLRLDQVDNGLVLRFGPAPVPAPQTQEPASRTTQPEVNLPIPTNGTRATPISQPVTREDLNLYSDRMLRAMETMVDDAQMEHNQRMARILGQFYEEMRDEQDRKYQILRQRVDGVGLGLMSEQNRMNQRISRFIDEGPVNELPTDSLAAPQQPEKDK
ncbi:MAG TPA: hypothetical protein VFP10_13055 [Candidatus Eisenbacteria bacterium]|nr:hypothetical protein [Candidatus Eisenbacteria bacterium]